MEDLDPDLVRDMKTLRSLITTRWTSFRALRSFFLDTSCSRNRAQKLRLMFKLEASSEQDSLMPISAKYASDGIEDKASSCIHGLHLNYQKPDTLRKVYED